MTVIQSIKASKIEILWVVMKKLKMIKVTTALLTIKNVNLKILI